MVHVVDPSKCKQIPVSFSRNQSDHFFWGGSLGVMCLTQLKLQQGLDNMGVMLKLHLWLAKKSTTKSGLEQNKKWLRETLGFTSTRHCGFKPIPSRSHCSCHCFGIRERQFLKHFVSCFLFCCAFGHAIFFRHWRKQWGSCSAMRNRYISHFATGKGKPCPVTALKARRD